MSAYVVENITINRIISGLNAAGPLSSIRMPMERLGFDLDSLCSMERLGDAMLELNIFSIRERYGYAPDWVDMIPDDAFELEYVRDSNPMQFRKSLGCFLYQACEGRAETDHLFGALAAVRQMLADVTAKDRVLYEEADWG